MDGSAETVTLCVFGSLNTDLVTRVDQFPGPGQTVRGLRFDIFPGGKGANQAVAAARLGAKVSLVGKLGDDVYGKEYREVLAREGINADEVTTEEGVSSGVAVIQVDRNSENSIVVVPGANGRVGVEYLDQCWPAIEASDIVLLQLEIPIDTVFETCRRLHAAGKTVILDPAPAMPVPEELYRYVDYLTPNEHELAALAQREATDDVFPAAASLVHRGARNVIVKRSSRGAAICSASESVNIQGYKVEVADTTAAGDSFNAGLAVALGEGASIVDAVRFANAVGALSTTKIGAQSAMPRREEVASLMRSDHEGGLTRNAKSRSS